MYIEITKQQLSLEPAGRYPLNLEFNALCDFWSLLKCVSYKKVLYDPQSVRLGVTERCRLWRNDKVLTDIVRIMGRPCKADTIFIK